MSKAAFSVNLADQAEPFIWGSLQDTTGLTTVYQGTPYLVAKQPPGDLYLRDALGRLTQIRYANGRVQNYTYDNMGNRQTVVTT